MEEEEKDTNLTEVTETPVDELAAAEIEKSYFSGDAPEKDKFVENNIVKELRQSFLDYSLSVITSRAIPDLRDGLKPVHRRILWSMYENGYTPDKPHRKCAKSVGEPDPR